MVLRSVALALVLLFGTAPYAVAQQKEMTADEKAKVKKAGENAEAAAGAAGVSLLVMVALCVGAFLVSMIPAVIAFSRGHPNAAAITVLCLFLGWTCLGWIGALVWSFTAFEVDSPRRSRRRNYDDDE